jgi:hypothetical protein
VRLKIEKSLLPGGEAETIQALIDQRRARARKAEKFRKGEREIEDRKLQIPLPSQARYVSDITPTPTPPPSPLPGPMTQQRGTARDKRLLQHGCGGVRDLPSAVEGPAAEPGISRFRAGPFRVGMMGLAILRTEPQHQEAQGEYVTNRLAKASLNRIIYCSALVESQL